MRRTDRLYALVEELRARAPRPVSRGSLAERFEVSTRTVERDVFALQSSGVPIWTQRGRGGGYAIDPRWSLPPLNFDATEAIAVIAALTAARSMPFADAGRRAEQKILAAMRIDDVQAARELAGRLRLPHVESRTARRVLSSVETAVVERRVVMIEYSDRDGRVSVRPVEAHGLHISARNSYLIGWCRLRDDARAFRLDRVVSVTPTHEVAPPREIDSLLDWDDAVAPEAAHVKEDVMDKPLRRSGPPRRADDTTGSTTAFARAVALSLPKAREKDDRGGPSFNVGGKVFLGLKPDDRAFIRSTPHDEAALTAERPDAFESDDGLQVQLRRVGRDEVRELIERAWRLVAPKTAVSAFTPARKAGITFEDVRRLALSLPGVEEQQRRRHEFVVRDSKKWSGFAWVGQVNNLLPPDDADALMIYVSPEESEALIAHEPDRFFTTPHYVGHGWVVTRLSENGPEDLEELWELFASAWGRRAPKELVDQLDVKAAKAEATAQKPRRARSRVRPDKVRR